VSWKLRGYDTFEEEYYDIEGEHPDEATARKAAQEKLADLNLTQPIESSGGQEDHGIQDRIFIVRPDGSTYRFLG